jgi:hypothetical protein
MVLQLDELRLAVGSPAGAAEEHDQSPSSRARGVQVDDGPALVGQPDVGERRAQSRANGSEIDRWQRAITHAAFPSSRQT